ncbi:MAG: hypothetical protein RL616_1103 [Verrucomicrobiota bacterium]|jgi:hypothetical protein
MIAKPDAKIKPAAAKAGGAENFRRLNWNEQVRRGDFVEDGKQGFELWAGMVGFQADTFVKTIYRRKKTS